MRRAPSIDYINPRRNGPIPIAGRMPRRLRPQLPRPVNHRRPRAERPHWRAVRQRARPQRRPGIRQCRRHPVGVSRQRFQSGGSIFPVQWFSSSRRVVQFSPSFRLAPESTPHDFPRHSGASRNLRPAICPSFRRKPESTPCAFPRHSGASRHLRPTPDSRFRRNHGSIPKPPN